MDEPSAKQSLARLLRDLSEELPADRPLAPLAGEGPFLFEFEIGSRPVKLLCGPLSQAASVTVACPLGPVPDGEAQAQAVLRQLLRVSHLTATSGTSVGYEPLEACLHLLLVVPLATASARLLLAAMAGLADMARRWQEDHFLGADPPPGADEMAMGLRA